MSLSLLNPAAERRLRLGLSDDAAWALFDLGGNSLITMGINEPQGDAVDARAYFYLCDATARRSRLARHRRRRTPRASLAVGRLPYPEGSVTSRCRVRDQVRVPGPPGRGRSGRSREPAPALPPGRAVPPCYAATPSARRSSPAASSSTPAANGPSKRSTRRPTGRDCATSAATGSGSTAGRASSPVPSTPGSSPGKASSTTASTSPSSTGPPTSGCRPCSPHTPCAGRASAATPTTSRGCCTAGCAGGASRSWSPRAATATSTAWARTRGSAPAVASPTSPPTPSKPRSRPSTNASPSPGTSPTNSATLSKPRSKPASHGARKPHRLQRRRVKVEKQRKKLLDAYYADAIDIGILKTEQQRLGVELSAIDEHLAALDTGAAEWRNVLDVALRFATDCHTAYRNASDRTKKRFNTAVFDRLEVRDGRITDQECNAPFDLLFRAPEFS